MSKISEITKMILDSEEATTRMKNLVVRYPERKALVLALRSHEQHNSRLEQEFSKITNMSFIDVCRYRLFTEDETNPKLPSLASALQLFQSLYSLVFDAIETKKPKMKASISATSLEKSTFNYGYSFAGSLDFTLTLPNERLLIGDSDLDEAINTTFDLLRSRSSDQIRAFSNRLGPAVINIAYKWAESLGNSGIGADIEWCRGDEIRSNLFIQVSELRDLQQAIVETSDDFVEKTTIKGRFVGSDIRSDGNRSFHLTTDENGIIGDIRGLMNDAAIIIPLPMDCTAEIRVTTRINYATDTEEKEYYLLSHR